MDTSASDTASSGIYDLPRDLVRTVLETACREPVTDYTARLRQRTGLEGIFGEYLVASFTARTVVGRRELPMFVRRQLRPADRKRQAHHYEYLSAAGVALPRLYGSHVDAEGREVLFLELLDEIGATDEALLARRDFVLNWGGWLPWSVHILGRIEARAPAGDLGDGLRGYCSANPQAIRELKRICLPLMGAVHSLPVGLVHGDLRPGNTGRRAADGALVLHDLEDLSIDARFYDIGLILGGPRPLVPGTHSNDELARLLSTLTDLVESLDSLWEAVELAIE